MRQRDLQKHFYSLQKVNTPYIFEGAEFKNLLTSSPNPADLENDADLDLTEDEFTNTEEAEILDEHFILVPDLLSTSSEVWYFEGLAKAVATLFLKTDGEAVIDKVIFELGEVSIDTYGNPVYDDKKYSIIEPAWSSVSAVYERLTLQGFLELAGLSVPSTKRVYLRIKVRGHLVSGSTATVALACSRGSADSYLEVFTQDIE